MNWLIVLVINLAMGTLTVMIFGIIVLVCILFIKFLISILEG